MPKMTVAQTFHWASFKILSTMFFFTSNRVIISRSERSKAEGTRSTGESKAWRCDLCATRSGIGATKVNKTFWRPRRPPTVRRQKNNTFFLSQFTLLSFLEKMFFWEEKKMSKTTINPYQKNICLYGSRNRY